MELAEKNEDAVKNDQAIKVQKTHKDTPLVDRRKGKQDVNDPGLVNSQPATDTVLKSVSAAPVTKKEELKVAQEEVKAAEKPAEKSVVRETLTKDERLDLFYQENRALCDGFELKASAGSWHNAQSKNHIKKAI